MFVINGGFGGRLSLSTLQPLLALMFLTLKTYPPNVNSIVTSFLSSRSKILVWELLRLMPFYFSGLTVIFLTNLSIDLKEKLPQAPLGLDGEAWRTWPRRK